MPSFGDLVWECLSHLTDVAFVFMWDRPHGTLASQLKGLLYEALYSDNKRNSDCRCLATGFQKEIMIWQDPFMHMKFYFVRVFASIYLALK